MEKSVKEAGVVEAGIYAVLNIPEPLKSPESRPEVSVDERRNDKGDLEIEFYMVWVGYTGDPEYRAWVQKTLEELRDRTIERCGGR